MAETLPAPNPLEIDTLPTKSLFIEMLTKDIRLIPAILDLADNSVDGARRIRGEQGWAGLWIRLTVSPGEFQINDNCGGFDVETARQYAFRFGRPPGAPAVKHSVGQFGIGMKRALFKLGNNFEVSSATATTRFDMKVSVPEWAQKPEWKFAFSSIDEHAKVPKEERRTKIRVWDLFDDVNESFRSEQFRSELKEALKSKLSDPLSRGLAIFLNGTPITASPLLLLSDNPLRPAFKEMTFDRQAPPPVYVKIYCGLGPSEDPEDAGWHVYCNGRLIIRGDKTDRTGWDFRSNGISIPGFHGQYNHLRGLVYFDSDDSGKLPWNTTKTDLNIESPVFRTTRLEMVTLMRPVVDFLNTLKREKDNRQQGDGPGPLEALIAKSPKSSVAKVQTRTIFMVSVPSPPRAVAARAAEQRIQYVKPKKQVDAVMRTLNVYTYKEVGEKTFEYYYNAEVEE
jgi:Histidine kinase-, DNA gyrase B-, and HSP90-like ATPase